MEGEERERELCSSLISVRLAVWSGLVWSGLVWSVDHVAVMILIIDQELCCTVLCCVRALDSKIQAWFGSLDFSLQASVLRTPGLETPGLETPGLETPGLETPGLTLQAADFGLQACCLKTSVLDFGFSSSSGR